MQDCYLIDSGMAHIGLLVWFGEQCSPMKREECARRAELILWQKKDYDLEPVRSRKIQSRECGVAERIM